MREDLVELIEYAEHKGQVTGLMTDGLKLSDSGYLNSLLQAGLDHATIILHPDDGQTWEALASFKYWAEVLNEDIFVTAHLTITHENGNRVMALLDKLAEANVSAVSLSAHDQDLADELQGARSHADDLNLSLVWDLPVPYSGLNPVALELEAAEDASSAGGAGVGWLYVEPDGDVLPAQGINEVLGNLLRDEWPAIWKKSETYRKK
jgi:MoaA/NifB/PqqE/SkfB family radical SAM enzyme